jgi:Family of unknown function (DUF6011)
MRARKRPAPPQNRPSPNHNGYRDSIAALTGHQHHEPLTIEDRRDIDVLIAAAERGFRLAVQCTECQSWLTNPVSVRRHLGPVCAKRVAR